MTSEPLYKSIYYELKKKIEDGLYSKDDYLPTENKLSKKYNVSRVTIRQAIQMLVEDGYVQKKQGSGTHVHPKSKLSQTKCDDWVRIHPHKYSNLK